MQRTNKMRQGIGAALGYIAIMAVGMAVTRLGFGIRYGDPQMMRPLVGFEVGLCLFAVVMARRIFGAWHCGFNRIDWRGAVWMLPNLAIVAAMAVMILASGRAELPGLAVLVIVTTCLVGFSEELMFRGVALQGALSGVGRGQAVVMAAGLFAALHSVNVLAGVSIPAMVTQLGLTFVFGLAAGCLVLRINSLWPMVVFHALWDMLQFLAGIYQVNFGLLIMAGILVNAATAAALWLCVLRPGVSSSAR